MLAKEPDDEVLLLASAELAALSGDNGDAARKLLDRAIAAHPASPTARIAMITLAMRERDPKVALAAAQAAAAAIPGDLRIQESLAAAQIAAGDPNQAVDTWQRMVKAQPRQRGGAHPAGRSAVGCEGPAGRDRVRAQGCRLEARFGRRTADPHAPAGGQSAERCRTGRGTRAAEVDAGRGHGLRARRRDSQRRGSLGGCGRRVPAGARQASPILRLPVGSMPR